MHSAIKANGLVMVTKAITIDEVLPEGTVVSVVPNHVLYSSRNDLNELVVTAASGREPNPAIGPWFARTSYMGRVLGPISWSATEPDENGLVHCEVVLFGKANVICHGGLDPATTISVGDWLEVNDYDAASGYRKGQAKKMRAYGVSKIGTGFAIAKRAVPTGFYMTIPALVVPWRNGRVI